MKNKTILAVSVFVTVFVLTVGIGVITNVSAKNNLANANPTLDATAVAQRELAYQQIIEQANLQIEEANQQIATLANQTLQAPTVLPSEFLFSADQASALAQQIAGVAPKETPILISFSGTPAYEVVYGNGNVYVDANSGAILFNGLQKVSANITSEQALYIATEYLGSSQPVDIKLSTFNGAQVYVVLFSDGQSVYVNMAGQVVAVQMASPSSSYGSSNDDSDDDEHEDDD